MPKQRTKLLWCDIITMACGMVAASLVSFQAPQPYFWMAFPLYVVGAFFALTAAYMRKSYPMVVLFGFYLFIDGSGVINWWPW